MGGQKKIKFFVVFMLILVLTFTGCNNAQNEEIDYGKIYILALDSLISIDEGLNSDIKYIAIDIDTLEGAAQEDINYIMTYFEKYGVEVIAESFVTLREKGMVKEGNYIEGLLLRVDKIDKITKKKAVMEVSKFRSGLGAIGVRCKLIYSKGTWELKNADMMWIS